MILITGASGLLGSNLSFLCSLRGLQFHGTYLEHVMTDSRDCFSRRDLRSKDEVQLLFHEAMPDVVVNCSAYTSVDDAEKSPRDAFAINADLPELLAEESRRHGVPFIHISTDGIFDGEGVPLTEQDSPTPANVYGRSKLQGENKVLAANSGALVIRTCIYGWSCMGRESLAERVLKTLDADEMFTGFTDVFFNPLDVGTLSGLILELANLETRGLINLGSRNVLSKFEFARALANHFGLDARQVRAGELRDVQFAARRPNYTALNCDYAERLLGRVMPTTGEGMRALRVFEEDGMRRQLKRWGRANGHD